MSILSLLLLFLVAAISWTVVPPVIRRVVNDRNGGGPVLVKHEYNKNSGRLFYELKMTIWHYRIMDRALVCNMQYRLASVTKEEYTDEPIEEVLPSVPDGIPPMEEKPRKPVRRPHVQDEQQCIHAEYWTNASTAEINMRGYKPVERLHDTLLWWGVPQYLMLSDAYRFNVPEDKNQYNQHTPATMDNKFKSQNYWTFLKKLFARQGMRDMDSHALIMVLILIAGAVGGMWMLGIF